MLELAAFPIWTAAAAVLTTNLLLLAGATGGTRAVARRALNPEDDADEVIAADEGRTARIGRAHRNALENIPLFLAVSLGWVATNPSQTWALAIFGLFSVARISHTVCYLLALSKPRTASFAAGMVTTFAMVGHLCWTVFAT